VLRDLRNRYLGSISGLAWALVQPLLLLAIYCRRFHRGAEGPLARFGGLGFVPYLALGLWPWTAFAEGLNRGTIAHPRARAVAVEGRIARAAARAGPGRRQLPHPWAPASSRCCWCLAAPGEPIRLAGVPLAFGAYLALFGFALGLAWLTAALNVFVRDLAVVLAQLLTLWFFLTPIFFAARHGAERFWGRWRFNPMAASSIRFRAALLPDAAAPLAPWVGTVSAGLALGLGAIVFARLERHFRGLPVSVLLELQGVGKRYPKGLAAARSPARPGAPAAEPLPARRRSACSRT
jgi:ABC-type polysaccharide/polyol phosphate export permease